SEVSHGWREFGARQQFSRKAATVNSQGREPLVSTVKQILAPTGRKFVWLSPLRGFAARTPSNEGLAPLAINFRPVGPRIFRHCVAVRQTPSQYQPPSASTPPVPAPPTRTT